MVNSRVRVRMWWADNRFGVALAMVIGLVALVGIVISRIPAENQARRDRYEAEKAAFFAGCLAHEPQYRCDYLWEQM